MPVNQGLIPSKVVDSVEATKYSITLVTDADVFWMKEVSIHGQVDQIDPFKLGVAYCGLAVIAQVDPGDDSYAVFLPMIVNRERHARPKQSSSLSGEGCGRSHARTE